MKLVPATEKLAQYLAKHSTALDCALLPGEVLALADLRRETAGMSGSEMQIAAEQGSFMYTIARIAGARRCVEIGCFTGYSAIAVAAALPADGVLFTIDKDARTMEVANRYFVRTGQSGKIRPVTGDGLQELAKLESQWGPGSFDLAFIDADKAPMLDYFEACLRLVRSGGVILADNTLWSGEVVRAGADDKQTAAIRKFNETVAKDRRVEATLVNVADGIMMLRKR
ncbi:MAG: hypothetical protein RIQ81_1499 [Pseudomonadota bacterium]|jgi:predicted O-methyltransferase YrrM